MQGSRNSGAVIWVLLLACLCGVLQAQEKGRLTGTVLDKTGAVLPGAAVELRNVESGVAMRTVTTEVGIFRFPEVQIGRYEVTVSLSGFRTLVRSGIEMVTGRNVDLELQLEVGDIASKVEVNAQAPVVQTTSGEVLSTIDNRSMRDLPLNGRNPLQLVALTAGAALSNVGCVCAQTDNLGLTVNGLRTVDTDYRLDGALYKNAHSGTAPVLPNPDTLEEFTVKSSNYSARLTGPGALVEISTRSGGNQFHGAVFEFLRNQDLDARNFFDTRRAVFKRNQYGAILGGPIIRNKLFFFGSYQGTKQRGSPSAKTLTLPTEAQRNGDFSSVSRVLIDPLMGRQFPGNIIPQNRLDPVAVKLRALLPSLAPGATTAVIPRAANQDDEQFLIRSDYSISSRNQLSVTYFDDRFNFQRDTSSLAGLFALNKFRNKLLVVRDSYTLSPGLTVSNSFSYTRNFRAQTPTSPVLSRDLGVNVPLSTSHSGPELRFFTSEFNFFGGGILTYHPARWEYRGQAAWSRGRHLVQFGLDVRLDREFVTDDSTGSGDWSFDGHRTASQGIANSGHSFADLLLGLPAEFYQTGADFQEARLTAIHSWIEDDWKVSPNLTVNIGMRWEPWLAFKDANGPIAGLAPGVQSTVAPDLPRGLFLSGDVVNGRDNVTGNHLANMAPRLGFAWNLGGHSQTVVRGGYGIFYATAFLDAVRYIGGLVPGRSLVVDIPDPPSTINPYSNYPGGVPFPFQPLNLSTARFVRPVTAGAFNPDFPTQYTQNWNLTVEQRLTSDASLSLGYVGNHSSKVVSYTEGNPGVFGPGATTGNINSRRIYPGLGGIEYYSTFMDANYHSLQVNFVRRSRTGLNMLANYVFSKTIDNDTSSKEAGKTLRNPLDPRMDRGPADTDVTHRVNLSFVYDLPKARSQAWPVRALVNGWQINGIAVLQTGLPFTVKAGRDRSLIGSGRDNADLVGNPQQNNDNHTQVFNPSAFALPALGTFGTLGRNTFRGPGSVTLDLGAFKNLTLTERLQLQFRAEAFNSFNHANFGRPTANFSSGSFGRITSAADPRVIQFGLKLMF